ncbi:MAG: PorT family protein [Candidatus Azobacteroides sp.]|nr:PorT family protein [Candidatus Azobacteroides sp.]
MKRVISGLLFLFTTWTVFSQNNGFRPEWSYGANAGIALSQVHFNPRVLQQMLCKGTGGLTVRYISEKNFGIQVEVNYAVRGWKEQTDTVRFFNHYARSLTYIELPLMTQFYADLGKKTRFIFNAGPQIGYNIGAKELERDINVPYDYYDLPIQKKIDYGLCGGMGVEVRTKPGAFLLEGRYYFGLSDIFNNRRSDIFQASSNQVISIKLTYFFRIFER